MSEQDLQPHSQRCDLTADGRAVRDFKRGDVMVVCEDCWNRMTIHRGDAVTASDINAFGAWVGEPPDWVERRR